MRGEISMKHTALILLLTIVTAYNVGDIRQTDKTPCVGAYNINLCEVLDRGGMRPCASRILPKNTIVDLGQYGKCIVLDKTSQKYSGRIDLAFKKNEVKEARQWGKKLLDVKIL